MMDDMLVGAIKQALGEIPRVPYDLKKVKMLSCWTRVDRYYENVPEWIVDKQGDFSAIASMENLHTLLMIRGNVAIPRGIDSGTLFREYQYIYVDDFSFLSNCKKLKKLDVSYTNFTDCSILQELPVLTYVKLPEKEKLINIETLGSLKANVEFRDVPIASDENDAEKKISISEDIKKVVEFIKAKTRTMQYSLVINKDKVPNIFDSKFGGMPYWDSTKEYPTDDDGKKMLLLAQINLDEANADERLPQQGMLQFFIANDDMYGLNNYCVVYHEKIDSSMTKQRLLEMDIPTGLDADTEYTPVFREAVVDVVKKETYMGPSDIRFEDVFRCAMKEMLGKDIGDKESWEVLSDEEHTYLYENLLNDGHHMLGYPYFTQDDPRRDCSDYYDTLLIQIDSEMIGREDYILWGDSGVGNFFINSKELVQKDFSQVLYNWDCC